MSVFQFKYQTNSIEVQEEPLQLTIDSSLLSGFEAKMKHYAGDKDLNESNIERTEKTFNAFKLNLDEAKSDFEQSIKTKKNEGIKQKKDAHEIATAAAKTVKGSGYGKGEYDAQNPEVQKKNFNLSPDLLNAFGMKAPEKEPEGGKVHKMDAEPDSSDVEDYPHPHNQHKDAIALHIPGANSDPAPAHTDVLVSTAKDIHDKLRYHAKLHVAPDHIMGALKSGMQASAIVMLANSGRSGLARLRSYTEDVELTEGKKLIHTIVGKNATAKVYKDDETYGHGVVMHVNGKKEAGGTPYHYEDDDKESALDSAKHMADTWKPIGESLSFADEWGVEIIKEGNKHKFVITDDGDILAEGYNLTYAGALAAAVRKSESLIEYVEEQVAKLTEEKQHEDEKYSRVLSIVKNLISK